jgi:four helix bundle protein
MASQNYRDLVAWQKAMDLAELVYHVTAGYPKHELYGLSSQNRAAAISVPSNIAEGQGRRSRREFLHHLSIAHGSLREVETQVLLARRLGYLKEEQTGRLMELAGEVGRLLNGLYNSLANERESALSGRP